MSWCTSELRVRLARGKTGLSPPVIYLLTGGTSFVDLLCFFSLAFAMSLCVSVYMCLVVICWERADLLALI